MLLKTFLRLNFVILLLFFGLPVFGYDNLKVHPKLTEASLGLAGSSLTAEQKNWIINGSVAEDADPRYFNHFYDPIANKGLSYAGIKYPTAKDWSKNQKSLIGVSGDYSIPAIFNNYKNGNIERAYMGVGHVLHLIQDMSVPAHTRLDPHGPDQPDPYEKWSAETGVVSTGKSNIVSVTNPDDAFDNLANYSHNNFYSQDTIDDSVLEKIEYFKNEKNILGKNTEYGYLNGYRIFEIQRTFLGNYYKFDFRVNLDYWNQLSPKAVGYGAGVLDYFIKQFAIIDKQKSDAEAQLSWWQKTKNYLAKLPSAILIDRAYGLGDSITTTSVSLQQLADNIGFVSNKTTQTFDVYKNATAEGYAKIYNQTKITATQAIANVINKTAPKVLGVKETSVLTPFDKRSEGDLMDSVLPLTPSIDPSPDKQDQASSLSPQPKSTPSQSLPSYPKNSNSPSIIFTAGDSTPPNTSITSSPPVLSSSTVADFSFSSDESGGFECSLDNGVWSNCSSTHSLIATDGVHNFRVRALDSAGNIDGTPAEYNWTIDTAAPAATLSSLNAEYPANGFGVDWSGDAETIDFDIEYQINSGSWQTWLIATTATSSVFNIAVNNKDIIDFRARARDSAGNSGVWSNIVQTKIEKHLAEHLVLSEVRVAGAAADDEFVELYNPTAVDIDLNNFKLKRKSSSGTEYNLVSSFGANKVLAHGYFLIVHPTAYTGNLPPDAVYGSAGYAIANDNTIILYNGTTTVDKVGLGAAADFETAPIANPPANQSITRKSSAGGQTAGEGNGYDTDNNSSDFILSATSTPQNSLSPTEPRTDTPILPDNIIDLAAISTATTAVDLSWTAPTTANLGSLSRYDLRYQIKTGNCNLNINWQTATTVPISVLPTNGANETFRVTGLNIGTEYCFALRTYNTNGWSGISNQAIGRVYLPGAAIAVDNTSSSTPSIGKNFSWSHEVKSTNAVLAAAIFTDGNYINSVTYGGVNMILAERKIWGQASNNLAVNVYYIVNPPVGAANISISSSYNVPWAGAAISLTNIDNVNPIFGTATNYNASTTFTLSQTAVDQKLFFFDALTANAATAVSFQPGSAQTGIYDSYRYGQTNDLRFTASYQPVINPGLNSSAWSLGASRTAVHALVAFRGIP